MTYFTRSSCRNSSIFLKLPDHRLVAGVRFTRRRRWGGPDWHYVLGDSSMIPQGMVSVDIRIFVTRGCGRSGGETPLL